MPKVGTKVETNNLHLSSVIAGLSRTVDEGSDRVVATGGLAQGRRSNWRGHRPSPGGHIGKQHKLRVQWDPRSSLQSFKFFDRDSHSLLFSTLSTWNLTSLSPIFELCSTFVYFCFLPQRAGRISSIRRSFTPVMPEFPEPPQHSSTWVHTTLQVTSATVPVDQSFSSVADLGHPLETMASTQAFLLPASLFHIPCTWIRRPSPWIVLLVSFLSCHRLFIPVFPFVLLDMKMRRVFH